MALRRPRSRKTRLIRELLDEAEQARQERDEMRDKLTQHEAVLFTRAGPPAAAEAPPPELVTAMASGYPGQAVILTVDGREVIAVLGDEPGDAVTYWTAIVQSVAEGVFAA